MTDIDDIMTQAITLARTQYGEREYEYKRIPHNWRSFRKRGQRGYWSTVIGGTTITREEYETKVDQGYADSVAAVKGELNAMHYYTYRRDQVGDGWQDALIAMIEGVT